MLNPLVTGESRHVLHLKIVLKGKISFVRAKLVQLLKKFTFEKFFFFYGDVHFQNYNNKLAFYFFTLVYWCVLGMFWIKLI